MMHPKITEIHERWRENLNITSNANKTTILFSRSRRNKT